MNTTILIGDEGLLVLCGEHLLSSNWQIDGVVSSSEVVVHWAEKNGIAVCPDIESILSTFDSAPDYLFSVTNFRILPSDVVNWPSKGAFNFHDGPLPELAGLNTPSWAILEQRPTHGISWHVLSVDVDGGGVCVRRDFELGDDDTALQANTRCFELGYECFQELVGHIENGSLKPQSPKQPQQIMAGSDKPKFCGIVSWRERADDIYRLYRATQYSTYRNGFASIKVLLQGSFVPLTLVERVEHEAVDSGPGTVLETGSDFMVVQAVEGCVKVSWDGGSYSKPAVSVGDVLPEVAASWPDELGDPSAPFRVRDTRWATVLRDREFHALQLSGASLGSAQRRYRALPNCSAAIEADALAAGAVLLTLGRMNETDEAGIVITSPRLQGIAERTMGVFAPHTPAFISTESTGQKLLDAVTKEFESALSGDPIPVDLFDRFPELRAKKSSFVSPPCSFLSAETSPEDGDVQAYAADIQFVFSQDDKCLGVVSALDDAQLEALDNVVATAALLIERGTDLSQASLMSEHDVQKLAALNDRTSKQVDASTIHSLVCAAAKNRADETALIWRDRTCTYKELLDLANQVSNDLSAAGFNGGQLVGVMLNDKIASVAAMLGILQTGNAYVPMDPDYPTERLQYIAKDAGLVRIYAEAEHAALHSMESVCVAPSALSSSGEMGHAGKTGDPDSRAYVIYTSGSTGNPKGVQVSHDNVVNFLSAMDDVIPHDSGTFLSVTTISFDISVLEIWWSLTRGLKVVFYEGPDTRVIVEDDAAEPDPSMAFSLYFWNTQDPAAPSTVAENYDLLWSAAKFADENSFEAVWSPERHFGSFGGPYPNPAITSATLAAITKNVKIRAGSCVMPLHHPIRVAEDWAMIDNFSNGRVGISFASGWMPRDFVLAPENHPEAKQVMFDGIDTVRALWRGESRTFTGPTGEEEIRTLPRPVQAELPSWLTTAGNEESFASAGRKGLNILTHLLGQSVEELAGKLKVYREAWSDAGHEGEGQVTLMLHTFVTSSKDYARQVSRGPMKAYLKSAMFLVKAAAWDFPTFKKASEEEKQDMDTFFAEMTEEDTDDLLEFAFQRYFERSGLFGAPADNLDMVETLRSIGVNEIGCLIDFGIAPSEVLENLSFLNELRDLCATKDPNSLESIVEHFGVTHLQCTPSQAKMFSLDPVEYAGLKKIDNLLIGGEPLPQSLADELSSSVRGRITNMYGPTETTVWSLTKTINSGEAVTIGFPIANTTISVVDSNKRPVPIGWAGELVIGGRGVTQGYLDRPELNEQKFIEFGGTQSFATGDVVRMNQSGCVEFIGRNDNQVKVRGYRIELGEIENAIDSVAGIRESAVVGEENKWAETDLVAYFVADSEVSHQTLRHELAKTLPSFMVPSEFVQLERIARTANGKLDRKSLKNSRVKAPEVPRKSTVTNDSASLPKTDSVVGEDVLLSIQGIWKKLLGVEDVDINSNFFDIGGHSILAVRMQGELTRAFGRRLPISELFQYPTIAGLAGRLVEGESPSGSDAQSSQDKIVAAAASRAKRRRRRSRK